MSNYFLAVHQFGFDFLPIYLYILPLNFKPIIVRYLIIILFTCFSALNVYSQKIDRWYQDGKVIFQLKQSVKKPISESGTIQVSAFPFLKDIEASFGVQKIVQLHPDIDDRLLNRTYQVEFSKINKVEDFINYLNKIDELEVRREKRVA